MSNLLHRAALLGAAGLLAIGTAVSASAQTATPAPSDSRTKAQSETKPADTTRKPAARSNANTDAAAAIGGQSVRKLVGKTVYNQQGESIGSVSDFVMSTRGTGDKKVTHAVVGVGGFLGLGQKDVAIPVDHLRWHNNRLEVSSNITADQLKRMADYDQSQYRSVVRENGQVRPDNRRTDNRENMNRSDRRDPAPAAPSTTR